MTLGGTIQSMTGGEHGLPEICSIHPLRWELTPTEDTWSWEEPGAHVEVTGPPWDPGGVGCCADDTPDDNSGER